MNRITGKDCCGVNVISSTKFKRWFENGYPVHVQGEAVDLLASYEDTGLTPEEIMKSIDYEKQELREIVRAKEAEIMELKDKVDRLEKQLEETENDLAVTEVLLERKAGEITGYINAIKIIGGVRDDE